MLHRNYSVSIDLKQLLLLDTKARVLAVKHSSCLRSPIATGSSVSTRISESAKY